jgi:subtilase family serine protease
LFPKPSYQNSVSNLSGITKRAIPDVSADADPNTGCIIAYNNKYYVVGGTSLAAPIWAAYLAGQKFTKFVTPLIYQYGTQGLHDILSGSNGAYTGKNGWDPVTGLGSPSGFVLTRLIR